MKLKNLKVILDKLSAKELEQPLLYNSKTYSISGEVSKVEKAKVALYWTGEDDPSQLYTKSELKNELGLDAYDIAGCKVEIPVGAIVITF